MGDSGSLDAALLVSSLQEHGITFVGPALLDTSWQACAAEGFALSDFVLEWSEQQAICPQGQVSRRWVRKGQAQSTPIPAKKLQVGTVSVMPQEVQGNNGRAALPRREGPTHPCDHGSSLSLPKRERGTWHEQVS